MRPPDVFFLKLDVRIVLASCVIEMDFAHSIASSKHYLYAQLIFRLALIPPSYIA